MGELLRERMVGCVGIIGGIDPGAYTLNELVIGVEAKLARQWDHTASIMCLNARLHSSKASGLTLAKFHPYLKNSSGSGGIKINADNIQILKKVFVDGFASDNQGESFL